MIQIINGRIERHGLPESFTRQNGETVFNYHLKDENTLKMDGWLPVENVRPEHDPTTEEVVFDRYEILSDKVIMHYKAQPITESDYDILRSRVLTADEQYKKIDIHSVTVDFLKDAKKKQLDYLCTQTILGRFSVNIKEDVYEFSNDNEAQLRFTGIGVMFITDRINEVEWTTYLKNERKRIIMNKTEFDIVSQAALEHQDKHIKRYNALLLVVDACGSNEEVNDVHW